MNRIIDFQEYGEQITRLIGEDVTVSFKGTDSISFTPFIIETFDVAIYPRSTSFYYNYCKEILSFHKEDISDISMSDDEDGLSFCITFSDKSYIIVGKEDENYES